MNKIILGDCLEKLKEIEDNTIDLVVTSPPYFNARDYSYFDTYEIYLDWLKDVFTITLNKLKAGRMCCVNISVIIEEREDRQHESKRIALPFHFVNLMENIGYKFLEDIIWLKPEGSAKNRNGGFYRHRQPIAYKPNIITEYIFVFQKRMDGLIDKLVRSYIGEQKELSLVKGNYEKTNVWRINPETNSEHPAPFPIDIPNKLISYYSYVGDTVLDMFSGSGTTAISAYNLGRNFICIEKDKDYYDKSLIRLNNEKMKKRLF